LQYTVGSSDPKKWVGVDAIGAVIRYEGKLCRVLGMYFGGDPEAPAGEQRLHQWLIVEDVPGDYPLWYAVQTKPRKEQPVESSLSDQGLTVLLPWVVYERSRVASTRKARPGRPRKNPELAVSRTEPLFPGYLFVQLAPSDHERWHLVRRTPGVVRILGTGDEPVPVPDDAIELILEKSFGSGIIVFRDGRPAWRDLEAGTRVEITEEPFRGLVGILEKPTSGRKRVRVLLEMMGQEVPVEVDAGSVKAVEDDS
jgi:transcription antitermination factor NusG